MVVHATYFMLQPERSEQMEEIKKLKQELERAESKLHTQTVSGN